MKSNVFFKLLVVVVLSIVSVNAFAQVRIGTNADPNPQAMLDIRGADGKEDMGVLFPRTELQSYNDTDTFGGSVANGLVVYNMNTSGTPLPSGLYVWNGSRWVSTNSTDGEWFYMPPTLISTDSGNGKTINLYTTYKDYLSNTKVSAGAPPVATSVYDNNNATDYYYYVIGYDATVFEITNISSEGVMTYNIVGTPTPETYINIIFVRK